MPIDNMGVSDIAQQGALAGLLGMIGRGLALASSAKRPSGWSLLWEIPMAIGMGVIGKGVADWSGLQGFVHYALVVSIAYAGPRCIDIALARWAEQKGK